MIEKTIQKFTTHFRRIYLKGIILTWLIAYANIVTSTVSPL